MPSSLEAAKALRCPLVAPCVGGQGSQLPKFNPFHYLPLGRLRAGEGPGSNQSQRQQGPGQAGLLSLPPLHPPSPLCESPPSQSPPGLAEIPDSERLRDEREQLQIIFYLYKKGIFSKRH